jgi:hypothetical protein
MGNGCWGTVYRLWVPGYESGLWVKDVELKVQGFRVDGLGYRFYGLGLRVYGLWIGFRVYGLGFRV